MRAQEHCQPTSIRRRRGLPAGVVALVATAFPGAACVSHQAPIPLVRPETGPEAPAADHRPSDGAVDVGARDGAAVERTG